MELSITPELAVQGAAVPVSKPGLPIFWPELEQPPVVPIVQVKDVLPEAPVVSLAVTVTLEVPLVVGVPVILPLEEMLSPVGRPVAL